MIESQNHMELLAGLRGGGALGRGFDFIDGAILSGNVLYFWLTVANLCVQ